MQAVFQCSSNASSANGVYVFFPESNANGVSVFVPVSNANRVSVFFQCKPCFSVLPMQAMKAVFQCSSQASGANGVSVFVPESNGNAV